jgi:aminopeptidase N
MQSLHRRNACLMSLSQNSSSSSLAYRLNRYRPCCADFLRRLKLQFEYSRDELMFLMTRDSDGFNRWNAAQDLAISVIQEMLAAHQHQQTVVMDKRLSQAVRDVLLTAIADARGAGVMDQAMLAQLMTLPSEAYLAELSAVIDVDGIHTVREQVANALACEHADLFRQLYELCHTEVPYRADAEGIARRSLKNLTLAYLMRLPDPQVLELCYAQFRTGSNMTEVDVALRLLVNCDQAGAETLREQALADFYQQWQHESLVVNQWFTVQATAARAGTLARVQELMQHPAFDIRNPNKVRALIGAFCGGNPVNFHDPDWGRVPVSGGSGHFAECVKSANSLAFVNSVDALASL